MKELIEDYVSGVSIFSEERNTKYLEKYLNIKCNN